MRIGRRERGLGLGLLALCGQLGCGGNTESDDPVSGNPAGASPEQELDCNYDDQSSGLITIEIQNDRSTPIFMQDSTCSGSVPPFSLQDGSGDGLAPYLGHCATTCAQEVAGSGGGCVDMCSPTSAVEIEPGGSRVIEWSARNWALVDLDPACLEDADEGDGYVCRQALALEEGSYTFVVTAMTNVTCSEYGSEVTCGDCALDEAGDCVIRYEVAGEELVAETTVYLDASYGLGAEADSAGAGDWLRPVVVFDE